MTRYLMIFATLSLASCGKQQVEIRLIVPDVPADLRTPATITEREIVGLGDVGLVMTDLVEVNDANAGKIISIDCILGQAEDKVAGVAVRSCALN
tara:strand:- start:26001 stop:26285 length:285 start_codon:yes stop_codon:yes gene_type:complete